jgi:DNA-binding NtrC family response regulator
MLAAHFYREIAGPADPPEPDPAMLEAFMNQPWAGNVRELRAAVERAVLLRDASLFEEQPANHQKGSMDLVYDEEIPYRRAKREMIERWETWYLGELLSREGGNISGAARAAQVDRCYLRSLLRKYKLVGTEE